MSQTGSAERLVFPRALFIGPSWNIEGSAVAAHDGTIEFRSRGYLARLLACNAGAGWYLLYVDPPDEGRIEVKFASHARGG